MNQYLKYILPFLFVTVNASAQNSCIPAQKDEFFALKVAVAVNQDNVKSALLSKYCFNFNEYYSRNQELPAIFLSRTPSDIELFRKAGVSLDSYKAGKHQLDLMSYLLLKSNFSFKVSETEKSTIIAVQKKYVPNISKESLQMKPISVAEHEVLLDHVSTAYQKLYSLPLSSQHNTALHFAVIANEPTVLKNLLTDNSRKLYLYRKNKAGIAPLHLVFATKKPVNKEDYQKKLEELNTLLINNIDSSKINYLKLESLSYFELAELFKDNNPDFYKKLKQKFNFPNSNIKVGTEAKNAILKQLNFVDTIISVERD